MMRQLQSLLIELPLFIILKRVLVFLFFFFGSKFSGEKIGSPFFHFLLPFSTSIFVVGFDLLYLIVWG